MKIIISLILTLLINPLSWAYLTAGKVAVTKTSSSAGVSSTSQDSDISDVAGSSISIPQGVNFGIGNSSPMYPLQINNPTQYGQSLYVQGNVGINTTVPSGTFEIGGQGTDVSLKLVDSTAQQNNVEMALCQNTSTLARGMCTYLLLNALTSNFQLNTRYNGNDYPALQILNNGLGNVGLGTQIPVSKLQIKNISGKSNDDFIISNQIPTNLFSIGIDKANSNAAFISDYSAFYFFPNQTSIVAGTNPNGTSTLALSVGGNVGIQENNPINSLDVNGNVAVGNAYAGAISATTNGMIIQGNVGIGTSKPAAILDVEGTLSVASFGGNVGVGTISPGRILDVNGTLARFRSPNNSTWSCGPNNSGTWGCTSP